MLSCFDTVGFLEGVEIGTLDVDFATSLNEGYPVLIPVSLKSPRAHPKKFTNLLAPEILLASALKSVLLIPPPILIKSLGHQLSQLSVCYYVNLLHISFGFAFLRTNVND